KGLNSLAPGGRYIELAVQALKTGPKLDLSRLVENQRFYSVDLRRLSLQDGNLLRPVLESLVSALEAGSIVPLVSHVYPFERVSEAMALVANAGHVGKVVLSHESSALEDRTNVC